MKVDYSLALLFITLRVLFKITRVREFFDVVVLDCVSFVIDDVFFGVADHKVLKSIDLLVVLDVRGEVGRYLRDLEFLSLQVVLS